MAKLNDSHESSLRRLNDTHREKIALLDRQFLQQKQQLVSGLWSLRLKSLSQAGQTQTILRAWASAGEGKRGHLPPPPPGRPKYTLSPLSGLLVNGTPRYPDKNSLLSG